MTPWSFLAARLRIKRSQRARKRHNTNMRVVKCCHYFIALLLLLGEHALAQTTTAKSNATVVNATATPSPSSSNDLEWYWIALIVGGSILELILVIFAVIGCMLLMQRSQEQDGQTYASALQRLLGRSPPRTVDKAAGTSKVIQVSLTRPYDYAQVPAC